MSISLSPFTLAGGLAALLALSTPAASAAAARFNVAGEAGLADDTPMQANGRFALKAQLVLPASAGSQLMMQTNERFALNAALSTSSLVCYNDTIFRDGFDGTGL